MASEAEERPRDAAAESVAVRSPTLDGAGCSLGRKNWLFTLLDEGGTRTGDILSIVARCIAHDVNPRAYLHKVVHCIVDGWPQTKLRDLLPDRMLAAHSELYIGDPDGLPIPTATRVLTH